MRFIEKISPEYTKFLKTLKELDKLEVAIGYQQGKAQEDDGTDICDIAAWNEYGTIHMPSRPFMRMSYDKNIEKINQIIERQYLDVLKKGKSAKEVMNELGVMHKGQVQRMIREGKFTANAPSTIKRKKSSQPLIDTGRMRQSVNFMIRAKGSGQK